MSKVVLFAASLLLVAGYAAAGIINPCNSPVVYVDVPPAGPANECYFACPQGDTKSLKDEGFYFSFTMNDLGGLPIPSIPATDFWMIDCDPAADMLLCAGSASAAADSSTNSAGKTTMSLTTLAVGNQTTLCVDGIKPVVQGYVLQRNLPPCTDYCFNGTGGLNQVRVRSADLVGSNLQVNIADFTRFKQAYPPNAYNKCSDFDCSGAVNIGDFARFTPHQKANHKCQ